MELLSSIGIWILFVCAVMACRLYCHGSIEARYGEAMAHRLSVLLSSVVIFVLGALYLADYPFETGFNLWWLGAFWLILSLLFELILCRYLLGFSWSELFRDYNLRQGRFYPVVLVTVFFTPLGSYYLFF